MYKPLFKPLWKPWYKIICSNIIIELCYVFNQKKTEEFLRSSTEKKISYWRN